MKSVITQIKYEVTSALRLQLTNPLTYGPRHEIWLVLADRFLLRVRDEITRAIQ